MTASTNNVIKLGDRRPAPANGGASSPLNAHRPVLGPKIKALLKTLAPALQITCRVCIGAVRWTTYIVLLWLRGPIRILLGLSATAALIALALAFFGFRDAPEKQQLFSLISVGLGLGSIAILAAYEQLLAYLGPQPSMNVNLVQPAPTAD